MNRTWLLIAFIFSAFLLIGHLYALSTYLYWYHRWFDIPMHVFGGVALGSFLLAFGTGRRASTYFLCMLLVVVGWEVFEYIGHISTGQPDYWIDTFGDICNGLIGACVPFIISRKTTWR